MKKSSDAYNTVLARRVEERMRAQNEATARHNRENPNALRNSRTIMQTTFVARGPERRR